MKDVRTFARIGAVSLFIDIANRHYKDYKDAARIYSASYDEMVNYLENDSTFCVERLFADEIYHKLEVKCSKYEDIINRTGVQAIVFILFFWNLLFMIMDVFSLVTPICEVI